MSPRRLKSGNVAGSDLIDHPESGMATLLRRTKLSAQLLHDVLTFEYGWGRDYFSYNSMPIAYI